jgi:hypothetical protein
MVYGNTTWDWNMTGIATIIPGCNNQKEEEEEEKKKKMENNRCNRR